ncbi:TM2 domain-containing protein [Paenibacillus piri]|nr:TM2 domain-containing protein [Paenibacillus piri]
MYNNNPPNAYTNVYVSTKSKTAAGLLAIFLGGFGIHKFYLGRVGWGIVYLLFCWTYIPSIVGFIEGIIYLASSDQSFNMKYGKTRTY